MKFAHVEATEKPQRHRDTEAAQRKRKISVKSLCLRVSVVKIFSILRSDEREGSLYEDLERALSDRLIDALP